MTQPTGSIRPLLGPLKFTLDMESSTPDDSITFNTLAEWSTTDSDERVDLVFNLSLNEYVALANSIDVGRDIAYGDNSILIWFIWVRTLKSMSICDAIIACIEDTESGVSDAIVTTVLNNTSAQDISVAQGQNDLVLGLDNNPECDLDILWGGINHLVDQMDINNIDALQILEVVTNVGEWVTDVAAGIFRVQASVITAMLEWALYIQDNILENYEAQITTSYMDTVKCDLFCIAKESDCVLTPTDLLDYFYGRLASQLSFGSLLVESLEFIVLGVWSGSEIADAMMLSQLVFRAQLGTWFGSVAFRSIDLDMRLGYDDPSDDWELLCDCPGEWTSFLDFTTTNPMTLDYGAYESGVGYHPVNQASDRKLSGYLEFDSSNVISIAWIAEVDIVNSMTPSTRHVAVLRYEMNDVNKNASRILTTYGDVGTGTHDLSAERSDFDFTADKITMFIRCGHLSFSGSGTVSSLTIKGTGDKPAQLP